MGRHSVLLKGSGSLPRHINSFSMASTLTILSIIQYILVLVGTYIPCSRRDLTLCIALAVGSATIALINSTGETYDDYGYYYTTSFQAESWTYFWIFTVYVPLTTVP